MAESAKFLRRARQLKEAGARFVALVVKDQGRSVAYLLELDGLIQEIEVPCEERSVPSLYSVFGLVDFSERDASRQHGLKFVGNPNLGESL